MTNEELTCLATLVFCIFVTLFLGMTAIGGLLVEGDAFADSAGILLLIVCIVDFSGGLLIGDQLRANYESVLREEEGERK